MGRGRVILNEDSYISGEEKMGSQMTFDFKVGDLTYESMSLLTILHNLSKGHFDFNGEVRTTKEETWQPLLENQVVTEYILRQMMLATHSLSKSSLFNDWSLQDSKINLGPFSLVQMLEFYLQKRIDSDSLVSHPLIEDWQALGQCKPFTEASLSSLLACKPLNQIISRRRTPRISFNSEVFISNQGDLYRGVSWSLSEGGLGVLTDNSTAIHPGEKVNVIINGNGEHRAIQVKGHIVSLEKEQNYDRLALEFDASSSQLNEYIGLRLPGLTS